MGVQSSPPTRAFAALDMGLNSATPTSAFTCEDQVIDCHASIALECHYYSTLSYGEIETAWEKAQGDPSVAYWVVFFLYIDSAVSQHVRKPSFSLLSSKSLMQEGSNKKNLLVNKTAPWKTLKFMPSVILSLEFKHRIISIICSSQRDCPVLPSSTCAEEKNLLAHESFLRGDLFKGQF